MNAFSFFYMPSLLSYGGRKAVKTYRVERLCMMRSELLFIANSFELYNVRSISTIGLGVFHEVSG